MRQTQRTEDALSLAIQFHHAYERMAPNLGYDTRKETRVFDPESPNGKLMISVIKEVMLPLLDTERTARLEAEREVERLTKRVVALKKRWTPGLLRKLEDELE